MTFGVYISEEQKMMTEVAGEFVEKEIWPKLDSIDKQEKGLTEPQ